MDNNEIFMNTFIDKCAKLRATKFAEYGESYGNFGGVGILARMDDKMARVKNAFANNDSNRERIAIENVIDVVNYGVMYLMVADHD